MRNRNTHESHRSGEGGSGAAPTKRTTKQIVRKTGQRGERMVPLDQFFMGYRQTVLARDEIVRAIRIPKPLPSRIRFYKIAKRSVDDISTVAAGIAIRGGSTRIALGGVAPTPIRAYEAEQALLTGPEEAKDALARTLKPIGDHRGSAEYRLAIAQSLLDKFFAEAGTGAL